MDLEDELKIYQKERTGRTTKAQHLGHQQHGRNITGWDMGRDVIVVKAFQAKLNATPEKCKRSHGHTLE